MRIEEFEESVLDLLMDIAPNATVVVSEEGEVIIFTNLAEDEDGELEELEFDEEFMDDEDTEQLEDEDEDEEETKDE